MAEARRLRARFLTALASSGLIATVAAACGGSTDSDGGSGGSGGGTGGSTAGTGGTPVGSGGTTGGASGSGATGGSGGTPVGSGGTTGGAGGSAGTPTCDFGTPAEQCFTLDELEAQLNNPPMGGDVFGDASVPDAWIEVTECLPREDVQDGCCNAASYGPEQKGELCCYVFCTGGCCGRAFVIGGQARLAAIEARSDWSAPGCDGEDGLDPITRRALADAWQQDARMEHASIASFARFTLELLGFGAPPELVAGAQQASLDEIEHARLCFALASRFANAPVGPGALEVSGSELSRSLAESAVATLEEGCIGETIAALTAREELARASDPFVRGALETIARDEERHAELAWRFVAWAVRRGGSEVREAVRSALARAQAPSGHTAAEREPGVDAGAWRRFGRLERSEAAAIRDAALSEVIVPCARAVLDEPAVALQAALT
jgi:hypothetical protein